MQTVLWSIDPPQERPRTFFDYAREYGSGLNVSVPGKPLTADVISQWGVILEASDAQLQFMHRTHQEFVQRHNAYLEREAPRYLPLTTELADLWKTIGPSTPEVAAQMKKVDQANVRLRNDLIALEHAYIDSIQPALTPEQSEKTILLRLEATRRNCRTFWTMARWSHLELRTVWQQSVEADATPQERFEIEAILLDYEHRLTPLVCRRADVQFEIRLRLTENRIASQQGLYSSDVRASRYRAIMRRQLDAALSERSVHEQASRRILETLREGVAVRFDAAVKQAVFPELYPDPAALHDLMQSIASNVDVSDDVQRVAVLILQEYNEHYRQLCRVLESICIEYGDRSEEGIPGFEAQRLPGALREPLEERLQLSREYLVRLTHLVGAEIMEGYRSMIPTVLTEKAPAADMQTVDTTD
ncbi:MAG TPA: hypothetical protein PK400_13540 [Phycisphaerales bacterium]|nr:hypothetical protein [Phycisphaerales bacterium]